MGEFAASDSYGHYAGLRRMFLNGKQEFYWEAVEGLNAALCFFVVKKDERWHVDNDGLMEQILRMQLKMEDSFNLAIEVG